MHQSAFAADAGDRRSARLLGVPIMAKPLATSALLSPSSRSLPGHRRPFPAGGWILKRPVDVTCTAHHQSLAHQGLGAGCAANCQGKTVGISKDVRSALLA